MAHICLSLALVAVLLLSQGVSAKQKSHSNQVDIIHSMDKTQLDNYLQKLSSKVLRDTDAKPGKSMKTNQEDERAHFWDGNKRHGKIKKHRKHHKKDRRRNGRGQTNKKLRGCSNFGHSCFGGHGKRSLDSSGSGILSNRQLGQEETPPHPVYPNSGFGVLPFGDDIIPVRDGGILAHDDGERELLKFKLRNLVKRWMDSYQRRQQNDDGYIVDNIV